MMLKIKKNILKISTVIILVLFLCGSVNFKISNIKNPSLNKVIAETTVSEDFLNFENAIIELNKENKISKDTAVDAGINDDNSEGNNSFDETIEDKPIEKELLHDSESQFALKRLIVNGKLTNTYGGVVYSYNNMHILSFRSEEETEFAYNKLKEDKTIKVFVDQIYNTSSYADNSYNYNSYTNWGAEAIDIGGIRQYLSDNKVTKEVVVVVMDTGINTSHEMFKNRLLTNASGKVRGFSYFNSPYQYSYNSLSFDSDDTNKYSFEDDHSHGTHVAGIICDLTPSNVKILPIKISDPANKNASTSSIILAAYLRVLNVYSNEFTIVSTNLSFSGAGKESESARDTFNTKCYIPLKEKNILPITAAGNEEEKIDLTGLEAIVVSSLKNEDGKYEYDSSYSNYGSIIDIAAPGSLINSATINSTNGANATIYEVMSGTSMASPQVAGAVALLYLDPNNINKTANEIEELLYEKSVDLGSWGKDIYYGHGMVNLKYFEVPTTATLSIFENDVKLTDYTNYKIFKDQFTLKIQCSNSSFKIIYTTDETFPTLKNALTYESVLTISKSIYIYAMGVKVVNNSIVEKTPLYSLSYFYEGTSIEDCFEINSYGTVTKYRGRHTEIVIPEYIKGIRVKQLGLSLFREMDFIKSVTVPASCTRISGSVFEECTNLKYVYAPGVTYISTWVFVDCAFSVVSDKAPPPGATDGAYFPNLQEIGAYCFYKCNNLETAELSNIEEIPMALFRESGLKHFTINSKVLSIHETAFVDNSLETITVEKGNKYFFGDGYGVYNNNSLIIGACGYTGDYEILSTVTIDGVTSTITTLANYSIRGCKFNELTIPSSITTIGFNVAVDLNVNTLYYNAINCVSDGYIFEEDGEEVLAIPFLGTINKLVVDSSVLRIPTLCFYKCSINIIEINSFNTKLEEDCFFAYAADVLPVSFYFNFTNSITDTWFTDFYWSFGFRNVYNILIKSQIPASYITFISSSLKYIGMDGDYYVYSEGGATVTTSILGNGTISPSGEVAVLEGTSKTFEIKPDIGWGIKDVLVDGASVGAVNSYTFSEISGKHTISVTFEELQNYYTITVINNGGGTISPAYNVSLLSGQTQEFTITPNEGYSIKSVKIDGVDNGALTTYTFANINCDHTIEVTFEINTYKISVSTSGNGSVSPANNIYVEHGRSMTFKFTPDAGYKISEIYVDGKALTDTELENAKVNGFSFNNVVDSHTVLVIFTEETYYITIIKAENGTITGQETGHKYGSNATFTITPNFGYVTKHLLIDGAVYSEVLDSYTFKNISANHTISAVFEANPNVKYTVMRWKETLDGTGTNVNGKYYSLAAKTFEYGTAFTLTKVYENGYVGFTAQPYEQLEINPDESTVINIYYNRNSYTLTLNKDDGIESVSGAGTYIYGQSVNIVATLKTGYTWSKWKSSTTAVISNKSAINCTFSMPAGNVILTATSKVSTYVVTILKTGNGNISPNTNQTVNHNSSLTFTITAQTGYELGQILLNDTDVTDKVLGNSYTLSNIQSDCTVHFKFVPRTNTKYVVEHMQESLTQDNATLINGTYYVLSERETMYGVTGEETKATIKVYDGFSVQVIEEAIIKADGSTVIKVLYQRRLYNLNLLADSGVVSVTGSGKYKFGESVTIDATLNEDYDWDKWESTDVIAYPNISDKNYTLTIPSFTLTLTATTKIKEYTVTILQTTNGTISPSTDQIAIVGTSLTFTFKADDGYVLSKLLINDVDYVSMVSENSYVLNNIRQNYIVRAIFEVDQNIKYTVNHYCESLTNTEIFNNGKYYNLYTSEILKGATNELTNAQAKQLDGFTAIEIVQEKILLDESTVVNVYYNRNIYALTLKRSYGIKNVYGEGEYLYGQQVIINADIEDSYDWLGWINGADNGLPPESSDKEYTFTMPSNSVVLFAKATIKTYTIEILPTENGTVYPDANRTVEHGSNFSLLFTPNKGYKLSKLLINNVDMIANVVDDSYTISNVCQNYTVKAEFDLASFTISVIQPDITTGTISPETTVVKYGNSQTFLFYPNNGYYLQSVIIDDKLLTKEDVELAQINGYTFNNVDDNHTITAIFDSITYTISISGNNYGTISPTGTVTVKHGESKTINFLPHIGYMVDKVYIDNNYIGALNSYTFTNIIQSHTLYVEFAVAKYDIVAMSGKNGEISPSGITTVTHGESLTYTITPNVGYKIKEVKVNGVSIGIVNTYTFTNITSTKTIEAVFELEVFVVSVSIKGEGEVTPKGETLYVEYGSSISINIKPADNWQIEEILVNNEKADKNESVLTLNNVQKNINIQITFKEKPASNIGLIIAIVGIISAIGLASVYVLKFIKKKKILNSDSTTDNMILNNDINFIQKREGNNEMVDQQPKNINKTNESSLNNGNNNVTKNNVINNIALPPKPKNMPTQANTNKVVKSAETTLKPTPNLPPKPPINMPPPPPAQKPIKLPPKKS